MKIAPKKQKINAECLLLVDFSKTNVHEKYSFASIKVQPPIGWMKLKIAKVGVEVKLLRLGDSGQWVAHFRKLLIKIRTRNIEIFRNFFLVAFKLS